MGKVQFFIFITVILIVSCNSPRKCFDINYAIEKTRKENEYEIIRDSVFSGYFGLASLIPKKISNTQSYFLFMEYLEKNGINRNFDYSFTLRFDSIFATNKISIDQIRRIKKIIDINNLHTPKRKYINYTIEEYSEYSGFGNDKIFIITYKYLGEFCREYKPGSPSFLFDVIILGPDDSVLIYKYGKSDK